jgi:hypothetical protein
VAAAALALGGCGGGGSGNDDSDTPASSGSIIDCFTANKTVSFALAHFNLPANSITPTRSTIGPMTYNGKAVTGQTFFVSYENTTYTASNYWTVTSNGITKVGTLDYSGTLIPDETFLPYNMSPGQVATNSSNSVTIFIGFETVSLAGKTFSTCHFKGGPPQGEQAEEWYAPGYGQVKSITTDGITTQYNGDL